MKGCLYAIVGLFALILVSNLVFWVVSGPANPNSVPRLERAIAAELPSGTGRAQVKSWLIARGFDVYPECFNANYKNKNGGLLNHGDPNYKHSLHDLGGRKYRTRSELVCSYDVIVSFAFDDNQRLIRSGVQELSACL